MYIHISTCTILERCHQAGRAFAEVIVIDRNNNIIYNSIVATQKMSTDRIITNLIRIENEKNSYIPSSCSAHKVLTIIILDKN